MSTLTEQEFTRFRQFMYVNAGVTFDVSKKALIVGRLQRRLEELELPGFGHYLEIIEDPACRAEAQVAIDRLTTNETFFFREPKHFDLLRERAMQAAARRSPFRVWSAACSTGEEPYSIAMVLADCFGVNSQLWSVVASDISSRVLERARRGHYGLTRTELLSPEHMRRYCLKGVGKQSGTLLIDARLRSRVDFQHINLDQALPPIGQFDLIFLRNVMIYFNQETKSEVVSRVLTAMKPDGLFIIGHGESLQRITAEIELVATAAYRFSGSK